MAGRYGKLNRKGAKATGEITVGVINGQPSLQVNNGGKVYSTQLNQVGSGSEPLALKTQDINATGNVTFGKNSKLYNNSNRILMTGGLVATGDNNMVVGSDTNLSILKKEDSGSQNANNLAFGINCMQYTVNGYNNIAIGNSAMLKWGENSSDAPTLNHSNVAVGNFALAGYTGGSHRNTGKENVAIGYFAMAEADVQHTAHVVDQNVAIGRGAGYYTSYTRNVYVGYNAGFGWSGGSDGSGNVGIGANSLLAVRSGTANTAIGPGSLATIATGSYNIGVGYDAGAIITSGDHNVAIGRAALPSGTADSQLIISSGDGGVTWINGTSAGLVGIGTVPTSFLHLKSTSADVNLKIETTGSGKNATMTLNSPDTRDVNIDFQQATTSTWTLSLQGSTDNFRIISATGAGMSIAQDGDVGIGTNAPTFPLEVVGSGDGNYIAHFNNSGTSNDSHGIQISAGDTDHADDEVTIYVALTESDATSIGGIGQFAGDVDLFNSSDERLKKNIRDTETKALEIIDGVKMRDFEWKKSGISKKCGMVAQELEKVLPKAVVKPTDIDDTYHIKKTDFIYILIKAVQELSTKVGVMQTEINNLEGA